MDRSSGNLHLPCDHILQIHYNPYGTGEYYIHQFRFYFFYTICFYKSQNVPNWFFYLKLLETRERVSSDAKAKSKGFLNSCSPKLLFDSCFFLLDVLAPLRHLSLNLQDRTALISCQHDSLESALEAFLESKTRFVLL